MQLTSADDIKHPIFVIWKVYDAVKEPIANYIRIGKLDETDDEVIEACK